jgi:hypothetical protein
MLIASKNFHPSPRIDFKLVAKNMFRGDPTPEKTHD